MELVVDGARYPISNDPDTLTYLIGETTAAAQGEVRVLSVHGDHAITGEKVGVLLMLNANSSIRFEGTSDEVGDLYRMIAK